MGANDEKIYSKGNYEVDSEGQLYYLKPMQNAEGVVVEAIANHSPLLKRIVRKQDGFTTTEEIEFSARRKYRNESPVCVDKKTMIGSQPQVMFSPACRIYLGKGNTAHYSEFMQIQCEDAEIETVYSHTGWILTDEGERVYLNGGYSIDKDGLSSEYSVELDPDFQCFQFYPVTDDSSQCLRTVVDGLSHAVPDWVSIPLLAYTFMTPLNEMLRHKGKEPCFSLYLIGKTGSYKSSLSKLLLCFFGRLNYADTAPVTFLDTQNAIGRKLAVGADLPLLLDDRRPTNNSGDKQRYEGIEKFVSSAIGDRATRGRLNADSSAKVSYVAKSNLIVTAEEAFVNIGSSSIARSVSVELQPDTVNFNALQNLQDNPEHFNKVMQLYIQWVINHYDGILSASDNLLKEYREVFSEAGHARLATAFSQLMFGYAMYLLFLKDNQQITEDAFPVMMTRAKTVFMDMCEKQSKKVDSEKPTVLFIDLLREMLETKRVFLSDLRKYQDTDGESCNAPITGKSCIGYRDDTCIYLIPQVAYTQVFTFYSESGYTFPASKTSLWKMLMDEGKIIPEVCKNGSVRIDKRKKINGTVSRYIWVPSSLIDDIEGSENDG